MLGTVVLSSPSLLEFLSDDRLQHVRNRVHKPNVLRARLHDSKHPGLVSRGLDESVDDSWYPEDDVTERIRFQKQNAGYVLTSSSPLGLPHPVVLHGDLAALRVVGVHLDRHRCLLLDRAKLH